MSFVLAECARINVALLAMTNVIAYRIRNDELQAFFVRTIGSVSAVELNTLLVESFDQVSCKEDRHTALSNWLAAASWREHGFVMEGLLEVLSHTLLAVYMSTWRIHDLEVRLLVTACDTLNSLSNTHINIALQTIRM